MRTQLRRDPRRFRGASLRPSQLPRRRAPADGQVAVDPDVEQEAEAQEHGQHGGAPIGDQRQGHPDHRDQPHDHGDVDEDVDEEGGGHPDAQEPAEVVAAADADGAIGLTGSYGYSATFSTSTAITTQGCLLVNSSTPRMEVYSSATTNTNRWFMPLGSIVTAALNLGNSAWNWIDLGGMVVVPSGSAIAVSVSEAIADIDMEITMVWEEVPA